MDFGKSVTENIYRQVVPKHFQSNKWKEILINPEGASTTLRDESTLPRSGGHRFKDIPNRFIFWRVLYDKLELVEHSLDTDLTENQVRIHFRDSPVLDSGISVYETSESVVLLVPTACSCHRLTFPKPISHENSTTNESVTTDASIFSNFNVPSVDDSATFYSYNAELSHPYSAASCLDQKHDAIFIIALQNNVILYIRLEYISGLPTLKEICQESAVPRILSNITKVFSPNIEHPVINSLAVHPFQQDIYVYSLDNACQLKVWSIDNSVGIHILDMKKQFASAMDKNGSRPHIIHKQCLGDRLLLTVYLSLSETAKFVVLEPGIDENGMFKLKVKFRVCSPMTSRLVDMASHGERIWGIWKTGKDMASIQYVNFSKGLWKHCVMDTIAFEHYTTHYSSDSKEMFLDKIFSSSTYFTEDDLKNAIAVYDTSNNCEFVTDYRTKISNVIESIVSQEMEKYDSTDTESQAQLIEQCSASFYKSCLDYRCKRLAPLGLVWLGSPSFLLVMVTNSSFCFLRPTDDIENKVFSHQVTQLKDASGNVLSVQHVEQKNKFNLFLDKNMPKNTFLELVKESFKFDCDDSNVKLFFNGSELNDYANTLNAMLSAVPEAEENMQTDHYSKCFRSKLGMSVVSHSFHQMIVTRFNLCCQLFVLNETESRNRGQDQEHAVDSSSLVFNYWILALFSHDIKLCEKLLVTSSLLAKESFMSYIDNVLKYVWPLIDGSNLIQFLLQEEQYNFIQQMAQLLNYDKWEESLVVSYMLNNNPDMALFIYQNNDKNDCKNFLKGISLFEKHNYYEHAVRLGNSALQMFKRVDNEVMMSMFYSNIFLNNLKLKAYREAFSNILALNHHDRKLNCLHTFVLTLLENGEQQKLLSLEFSGLQSSVEDIVLNKARSLSNADAAKFYMFLCAVHGKYKKYKKMSMIFYELYLRADTCVAQEQHLRLSLLYLEILSPRDAWFVSSVLPFQSASGDAQSRLIQIKDLKILCCLARARQEIDESMVNLDAQSVVSVLIMKHKYKEAARLSKMWDLPIHYPLRELVKTCLALNNPDEQSGAWVWLAANGVSDGGVDDGKIAWNFLETLVKRYEEEGKTVIHYHVADELLKHRAFLPNWLVKTFKERNVGELLQLHLSYGELINCADLIFQLIENESTVHSFGETIPVDIIECVIVNLKHHKLQVGVELLNVYQKFCNKIVTQESQLPTIKCL